MLDKLKELKTRYVALMEKLGSSDLKYSDMMQLNKERAQLGPIIDAYDKLNTLYEERKGNEQLLADADSEMREMAREEIGRLDEEIEQLEQELRVLLLPKDPNDQKNVVLEVRAGAGGDEASLFAGELFTMYSRFADRMRWKVELMSQSEGTQGGFKEIIALISGDQVYSWLKYEAGVHRVQRVPQTETQGRVHTSTCTVAVMPEAEEVDIQIKENEIRVDVFRAGGPGGQSVNTTDSAVRITHIPTGLVVQCQDEKSQLKNKNKALKVLRARLYEAEQERLDQERAQERRAMVKSGDRSDKIRTYNFPQDRCTDHRVGITVHNLPKLFAGELTDLVTQIRAHFQTEALKESSK